MRIQEMDKPLLIGVTGGIGSGKSLVCKILDALGVPIYDADTRARELMTSDKILIVQIKEKFGEASYLANGSLNREYLSKKVFNDESNLEILNRLVHPRVTVDSEKWIVGNKNFPYFVKEAALLF